jgi:3-methyladenine DNA glycosylase/8-oxoguanine DNA glycosylase
MRLRNVVRIVLGILTLVTALAVGFVVGRAPILTPSSPVAASSTTTAADSEQVLKEKLDNYSKRADDLQKLISLLLALTTVYAIALAASAYASVQNNLQQADKGIERLDNLVEKQHQIIESNEKVIPKQLEDMQLSIKFSTRIALASMISQFPPNEENYKEIQESVIKNLSELLELGDGQYATNFALNQQLARLHVGLDRSKDAEQVMSEFIRRMKRAGKEDDTTVVDAYYDRACYRSLRWSNTDQNKALTEGIKNDLSHAFSLDESLREYAEKDKELQKVAGEDWFKQLISG